METMHCVVLENDILKFIEEIETQLRQETICCKCKKPCDKKTKCAVAMKNLLTDVELFRKAYTEYKVKAEEEEAEKIREEFNISENTITDPIELIEEKTKIKTIEKAIERHIQEEQ